ncbi:hypothetical protein N8J89_16525 [Crossiella sp. CA-258035]|uniref:ABC transporter substrate-binding protein n=1 Tax=Crossiella sp. CA-258035 TaxID=2981138 RepID=UPI0024BBFB94|nr:hypothetical protein [Crossiella sp. CA-258035]WHT22604.1 hypothetical protein N8J89_16525 [Crossiella sp. CA-258035]
MATPSFRGLHALLTQVARLLDRPRWRFRRRSGEIRGDRPTPFLCLLRGSTDWNVQTGLENWLHSAGPPRVQHARIDVAAAEARVQDRVRRAAEDREPPLLPLLDELWHLLEADRFGVRLSRFRHYGLADWLTCHQPAAGRGTRARVLETLHDWYGGAGRPHAQQQPGPGDAAPWWLQALTFLLVAWHRPVRFRLWSHGVWPFGAVPRWLMRQPFMVPGHSTSFAGFAERLTPGRRDEENLDQLKKLLVHAFLEDLRRAYRPLRLRPRRWRRTAYVVLLLEGITEDNGGWELLQLINDVRNESTAHDPLFVVATATAKPSGFPDGTPPAPVSRAKVEVDRWYHELPRRRQSLREDARFVFLRLPGADEPPLDADESAWHEQVVRPRKPPLAARRLVIAAALTVLLVAASLLGAESLLVRWQGDCLPVTTSAGVAVRWLPAERTCVGYSDSAAQVFGRDDRLLAAQHALFEQNELAKTLHAENPRRPLVSLVYFADLTHPGAEAGTDASTSEELEGLLIRQRQHNHKDQVKPLLRIVVANGGDKMTAARTVVDELLAELLRADQTVLGVVGMGLTVPATESAIGAIGNLGVPVVATTLTGDALPDRSPLYFQIVPGNQVEAELIAEYARWAGQPVTIYHPKLSDNYLESLVNLTAKALGPERGGLRPWERRVGEVRIECGQDKIAFFVGREYDFPEFLREVVEQCDLNRPTVIGADTVARFVSQAELRRRDEFNQVTVSFVSMGTRIVLAGRSCRNGGAPESLVARVASGGPEATQPLNTFCAGYRAFRNLTQAGPGEEAVAAFAREATKGEHLPWPGERIGLAYDAAGLFLAAVERNQIRDRVPDPRSGKPAEDADHLPHRGAIAQELTQLGDFQGASGRVNFHESRTGTTRPAAILTVSNVHNLDEVPRCQFIVQVPVGGNGPRPWGSPSC